MLYVSVAVFDTFCWFPLKPWRTIIFFWCNFGLRKCCFNLIQPLHKKKSSVVYNLFFATKKKKKKNSLYCTPPPSFLFLAQTVEWLILNSFVTTCLFAWVHFNNWAPNWLSLISEEYDHLHLLRLLSVSWVLS